MKLAPPPGMRDFYPEDMRRQNWLFDAWRNVSLRFGFEEYEGPIFETLELYTIKSGEEIVDQLFHFADRGGREFAIRPEMTPTLARLVAARANALPRPIKWFSIPRMCRAERPQRGRLREFFQWNVDILGVDDPLADAEVIAVAAELFRAIGVTSDEVVIRYSSRRLAAAVLQDFGITPDACERAFQLIDRMEKRGGESFVEEWDRQYKEVVSGATVLDFLASADIDTCLKMITRTAGDAAHATAHEFSQLQRHLEHLNVADYCAFDMKVVRGLAYYTGTIFEAFPRTLDMRALLGGGRYDSLTELVGGPRVPGVGFGAGDAPLFEFLRELKRWPETGSKIDVFVIDADTELFPAAQRVASALRAAGLTVDYSYKRQNVGKQFKQAANRNARFAVVVGQEYRDRQQLVVKNFATGAQEVHLERELLADTARYLGR